MVCAVICTVNVARDSCVEVKTKDSELDPRFASEGC